MSSTEELEEMIRHLQTRLVYLEGRVGQLEAGHNPAVKSGCPKCGMKMTSPMGYVCAAADCPCFPRTYSMTIGGSTNAIKG